MILEMGLIVAGIPAGWLLRKNAKAQAAVGQVLTWAVRILLFLLGLSLGSNMELLHQFNTLGLRAALISTLSLAGSLVCARLLGRFLEVRRRAENPGPERTGTDGTDGTEESGASA